MRKITSICIIDDDSITVFGIRKMLSTVVDCENIVSYANGQLALDGIKDAFHTTQKVPEVIFLDINMPIMDGWQFLEAFISLPLTHNVRINIVTSSIDPLDRQNYEKYRNRTGHTLSYHQKPIRKTDIEAITKKA